MSARNTNDDDDFRDFLDEEQDDDGFSLGEDGEFPIGQEIQEDIPQRGNGKIWGMSAGERAFLSVVLFFNVLILGAGLLIATGRVLIGR